MLAGARAAGDFVEVQGTTFTTATCRDFVVSGYNTWQVGSGADRPLLRQLRI